MKTFENMNILIVDDSQASRNLIKNFLHKAGYKNLFFADSGKESIKILEIESTQSEKSTIDLILMDILMEGIDGMEAVRTIKRNYRYMNVPIVMIAAVNKIETLKKAFDAGAIDYIGKPINKIEFFVRIRSILRLNMESGIRIENEIKTEQARRKFKLLSLGDGLI